MICIMWFHRRRQLSKLTVTLQMQFILSDLLFFLPHAIIYVSFPSIVNSARLSGNISKQSRLMENGLIDFGRRKPFLPWEKGLKDNSLLTLVNDGPTILGANTAYYATLDNVPAGKYICYWSELKCKDLLPTVTTTKLISNKCHTSSQYTCKENLGNHTMAVRILQEGSFREIAAGMSTVLITEYINAKLTIQQDGTTCNTTDECLVTTKTPMQITVDIHDPSNFFEEAFLEYNWFYGDGNSDTNGEALALYNYSFPGTYKIQVNITAFLPDEIEKSGYVKNIVYLLDAVSNLTVKGNSDTTVGSVVRYNVSCNGSVPVSFCWSMVQNSQDNNSTIDNTTCIWTLSSPFCNDSIEYKFNNSGTYHLRVKAINDVSTLMTETKINVKIANVVEYTSIAAALVFGIILSLVSIAVVVHSYRKEKKRHVEVANFDFQMQDSSSDSTLSNFAKRLRTMVMPSPSSNEERINLLSRKSKVASELDVL